MLEEVRKALETLINSGALSTETTIEILDAEKIMIRTKTTLLGRDFEEVAVHEERTRFKTPFQYRE